MSKAAGFCKCIEMKKQLQQQLAFYFHMGLQRKTVFVLHSAAEEEGNPMGRMPPHQPRLRVAAMAEQGGPSLSKVYQTFDYRSVPCRDHDTQKTTRYAWFCIFWSVESSGFHKWREIQDNKATPCVVFYLQHWARKKTVFVLPYLKNSNVFFNQL